MVFDPIQQSVCSYASMALARIIVEFTALIGLIASVPLIPWKAGNENALCNFAVGNSSRLDG